MDRSQEGGAHGRGRTDDLVSVSGLTAVHRVESSASARHVAATGSFQYPRFHLRPLDLTEIGAYIRHQVEVSGHRGPALFGAGFVAKAFDYTSAPRHAA